MEQLSIQLRAKGFTRYALNKAWAPKVSKKDGWLYRGMTLNESDLKSILADGMKTADAAAHFTGIFTSKEVVGPLGYTMSYKFDTGEKSLAVLFAIDPAGLRTEDLSKRSQTQFVKVLEDVPASAIKRVYIFDPNKDLWDFPFYEFDPSAAIEND